MTGKVDETERLVRAMRRSAVVRMALVGVAIAAVGAFFLVAAIIALYNGHTLNMRLVVIGGSGAFIGSIVLGMAVVMFRRIAHGIAVETDERGEPLIPPARVVARPRSDEPASRG